VAEEAALTKETEKSRFENTPALRAAPKLVGCEPAD